MQIQFLKGITGYIWVFPRADHVSAGIAGKMGETSTAELRRVLGKVARRKRLPPRRSALLLAHSPVLSRPNVRNTRSQRGRLVHDRRQRGPGRPDHRRRPLLCATLGGTVRARVVSRTTGTSTAHNSKMRVLPELKLAASLSQRFYRGQIFGDSILERMVALTAQSASIRDLMSDLFAGNQGYQRFARAALSHPALSAGRRTDESRPYFWMAQRHFLKQIVIPERNSRLSS